MGSPYSQGSRTVVDGLGFFYPATMTAYRMRTTYTGRKCYTRMQIVSPGAVWVVFRGPWNIYVDVTPE